MIRKSLVAAAALSVSAPVLAQDRDPDYRPQAGERIVFDVYREGSAFGTHELGFSRNAQGDLEVDIRIRLRAGFGPITVFRYEHDSTEVWREDQLLALSGRTLKDGDVYEIDADLVEERIHMEGEAPDRGSFMETYDPDRLPSSHWHGYPASVESLINTEFGTSLPVSVSYLGEDEIEADGATIRAHHYRLEGSLTLDLWYDESGRWASCTFTARGQDIRYERRYDPVERLASAAPSAGGEAG